MIFQCQRKYLLDVVLQVSINDQLALMDLFVHRIVLDGEKSLPLSNFVRTFRIQALEGFLLRHLAIDDRMPDRAAWRLCVTDISNERERQRDQEWQRAKTMR